MSAPTFTVNDKNVCVITLFRKGERVSHVFRDHWISLHERSENGRGPLYYLIAHDYGTGAEIFVWLKDQAEFDLIEKEMSRDTDEAANFKKALTNYKDKTIGQLFVEAVKARHCARFCDQWLAKQESGRVPIELNDEDFGPEEPCVISGEVISSIPLKAQTDPLKLKELEERFPGATIVLTASQRKGTVKYIYEDLYEDDSANHMIWCEFTPHPHPTFASLGVKERPNLMVEWRGIYLDASLLF